MRFLFSKTDVKGYLAFVMLDFIHQPVSHTGLIMVPRQLISLVHTLFPETNICISFIVDLLHAASRTEKYPESF